MNVEATMLGRICKALGMTPQELAKKIGRSYRHDVAPMLCPKHQLDDIDRDDVWWDIQHFVSGRIGSLMAIRETLNVALQADRKRRALRLKKWENTYDRISTTTDD